MRGIAVVVGAEVDAGGVVGNDFVPEAHRTLVGDEAEDLVAGDHRGCPAGLPPSALRAPSPAGGKKKTGGSLAARSGNVPSPASAGEGARRGDGGGGCGRERE